MRSVRLALFGACALLIVTGCSSSTDDDLWPYLAGEAPTGNQQSAPPGSTQVVIGEPPAGTNASSPPPRPAAIAPAPTPSSIANYQSSGTVVGQKIVELRQELEELKASLRSHSETLTQLRDSAQQNANAYYAETGTVSARLQAGTTPGNPRLQERWDAAQAELDQLAADVDDMSAQAAGLQDDASLSAFLLESVRATYSISGAVEEDHAALSLLEDDANRTLVQGDRLLNDLSEEISRQTSALNTERANMRALAVAIANGDFFGSAIGSRAFASAAPVASVGGDRPLVVIRFDRLNVDYQNAVVGAVRQTLDRYPQARFDIVAVSPSGGNPAEAALQSSDARRNAQEVARTLTGMGLATEKLNLSATSSDLVQANEVRIFVR